MSQKLLMLILGGIAIGLTCLFLVAMSTVTGWVIFRPAKPDKETVARPVITVAPFQADIVTASPMATDEVPPSPSPAPTEIVPTIQPTTLPADNPPPDSAEPPLNLPSGSVNSITQEGLATQLVIPKLDLDAPITLAKIENGTWQVDHLGEEWVGHLEGTAAAGTDSNMVLAAHVTVRRGVYGPFAGLSLLTSGDEVVVYENDTAYHYRVREILVVDRTAVEVTYPTHQAELTLITCSRWSQEDGRYVERLVVKADLMTE